MQTDSFGWLESSNYSAFSACSGSGAFAADALVAGELDRHAVAARVVDAAGVGVQAAGELRERHAHRGGPVKDVDEVVVLLDIERGEGDVDVVGALRAADRPQLVEGDAGVEAVGGRRPDARVERA